MFKSPARDSGSRPRPPPSTSSSSSSSPPSRARTLVLYPRGTQCCLLLPTRATTGHIPAVLPSRRFLRRCRRGSFFFFDCGVTTKGHVARAYLGRKTWGPIELRRRPHPLDSCEVCAALACEIPHVWLLARSRDALAPEATSTTQLSALRFQLPSGALHSLYALLPLCSCLANLSNFFSHSSAVSQ